MNGPGRVSELVDYKLEVNYYHETLLDRTPDAAGVYWVGQLQGA
jgi:hypothetical protein